MACRMIGSEGWWASRMTSQAIEKNNTNPSTEAGRSEAGLRVQSEPESQ